ncbi:hypothetical protein [Paenibacillus daejeonensis]|uniref:hypothetical protein n=1 Tax=Paenibacillus daejeonensis TaxID=135193 RepID=UPI00037DDAD5|nr:hypothetical protein [Paenibacillus daejeonensis]
MNIRIVAMLLLGLLVIAGCQGNDEDAVEQETVEGFSSNEYTLVDGYYEPDGYKQVNSITYIKDNRHETVAVIVAIEDYYDADHNYIRSHFVDLQTQKSKLTYAESTRNHSQDIEGPLTIHIPEQDTEFRPRYLTEEQLAEIRAHILQVREENS